MPTLSDRGGFVLVFFLCGFYFFWYFLRCQLYLTEEAWTAPQITLEGCIKKHRKLFKILKENKLRKLFKYWSKTQWIFLCKETLEGCIKKHRQLFKYCKKTETFLLGDAITSQKHKTCQSRWQRNMTVYPETAETILILRNLDKERWNLIEDCKQYKWNSFYSEATLETKHRWRLYLSHKKLTILCSMTLNMYKERWI